MGPADRGISKINYISISYLGIIKLLNLCSICIFILKSMLFAMLIRTEADVVVLHRYYATLKCDNSYKKRVSWFTSTVNTEIGKKAVYEYLWTFPTQNQNFFRTNPTDPKLYMQTNYKMILPLINPETLNRSEI